MQFDLQFTYDQGVYRTLGLSMNTEDRRNQKNSFERDC